MYRLSHLVEGEWEAHSHPPVFDVSKRLVAGVPGGDPSVFQVLVECLTPPIQLLYVLHTPRGEAQSGRYQSPPISIAELRDFIRTFGKFLSADGRYDLWAHSQSDDATVVWDRHNLLFGYGPLDRYSAALRSLGFDKGMPNTPAPHTHYYREECDDLAKQLILAFAWTHSPLREADIQ